MFATLLLFNEYIQGNNFIAIVVAVLAALIGAVIGALLLGLITQLSARILTAKKSPRAFTAFMRLVGAGVAGVAVFLYVLTFFGGPGSGGSGGWGFGAGAGKGPGNGQKDNNDKKGKSDTDPVKPSQTVYVEVLMDHEIKPLGGDAAVSSQKYYRIEGSSKRDLMSLPALKEKLRGKTKKLYIVLGPKRSHPDVRRVLDLRTWAAREKIEIHYKSVE